MDKIQIAIFSNQTGSGKQGACDNITPDASFISNNRTELGSLRSEQFQLKYYTEGCMVSCKQKLHGGRGDEIEGHIYLPRELRFDGSTIADIAIRLMDLLYDSNNQAIRNELVNLASKPGEGWKVPPLAIVSDSLGSRAWIQIQNIIDRGSLSSIFDSSVLFGDAYAKYACVIVSESPVDGDRISSNYKKWINVDLEDSYKGFVRKPQGTLSGWEEEEITVTWKQTNKSDIICRAKLSEGRDVYKKFLFTDDKIEETVYLSSGNFRVYAQYLVNDAEILVNGRALSGRATPFNKDAVRQATVTASLTGSQWFTKEDNIDLTGKSPVQLSITIDPPTFAPPKPQKSILKDNAVLFVAISAIVGLILGFILGELDARKVVGKVVPKWSVTTDVDIDTSEASQEESVALGTKSHEQEQFDKLMECFNNNHSFLKRKQFDECNYGEFWEALNMRDYDKIREWDKKIKAIDSNTHENYNKIMEHLPSTSNPHPAPMVKADSQQFSVDNLIRTFGTSPIIATEKPKSDNATNDAAPINEKDKR